MIGLQIVFENASHAATRGNDEESLACRSRVSRMLYTAKGNQQTLNARIVTNNTLTSFSCWLNRFCVLPSRTIPDGSDGVGEMTRDVWLLLSSMTVASLTLNVSTGASPEDVEGVVPTARICNLKLWIVPVSAISVLAPVWMLESGKLIITSGTLPTWSRLEQLNWLSVAPHNALLERKFLLCLRTNFIIL